MSNLSLAQQFELAKTHQLLKQISAEDLREQYLKLLEYHYQYANTTNSLLAASVFNEKFDKN